MDADDFRALARSSRVLWRDVRFTWRERSDEPWERAWVRRPDAYRIEHLDGTLIACEREGPHAVGVGDWVVLQQPGARWAVRRGDYRGPVAQAMLMGDGAFPVTEAEALAAATTPQPPPLRADGLVARITDRQGTDTVPFYLNYHWIAMLDPFELADGDPFRAAGAADAPDALDPAETAGTEPDQAAAAPPALEIEELRSVDHHGRFTLEAIARTLPGYSPRCSCCPLLNGAHAYALETESFGGPLPGVEEAPDATAFRIRLDRATGICVLVETLDGSPRWRDTYTARIEAVDENPPDSLFDRS